MVKNSNGISNVVMMRNGGRTDCPTSTITNNSKSPYSNNMNGSTATECDSTTTLPGESSGKIKKLASALFEVDEDVYYQDMEDGESKNVLGTVEVVQGKKLLIKFMDGTEKWAHISRVKKITLSVNDDDDSPGPSTVDTTIIHAHKVTAKKKHELMSKESCQVTCGSCGTQKMITSKKAVAYRPFTTHQYNCRKCINKSKTSKNNNGVPGNVIAAHFLSLSRSKQPHSTEQQPSNSYVVSQNARLIEGLMGGSNGAASSLFRSEDDPICLHCRTPIMEKVSLHCTMCERPCHPSCLALTPPPLAGDIFWSIICHICGTQKPDGSLDNDTQKLYSSRRSITCWSDVAYLLLSCMGCRQPNERFFDLDSQIIPFWEENLARLHLPRQYKQSDPPERRRSLLVALNNANLRFTKDDRITTPELPTNPTPLFAIKDRCLNVLIKQQQYSPNSTHSVTAAGFPISVRATNPEAASVAMSNIAQTIAVQAAANKSVPSPKNSPTNSVPKCKLKDAKKSSSKPPQQCSKLTASPGGAARVSMIVSPSSSRFQSTTGSFPVRKNGSPIIMSKSIMLETVVNRDVGDKVVKRKLSTPTDPQTKLSSKKLKMIMTTSLPPSTHITTKTLDSPTPIPLPQQPKKQSMSPYQKLSDLQKNGGLTVACLTPGMMNGDINRLCSYDDDIMEVIQPELHTPVKKPIEMIVPSPCQSSPSVSPSNQTNNRPVRLKRSVVVAALEKKKKKKTKEEKLKSAATVLVAAAKSRGRPKAKINKFRKLVDNKPACSQFNGNVVDEVESDKVDLSWGGSTVDDLIAYGVGYRLHVLPEGDEKKAIGFLREEVEECRAPKFWEGDDGVKRSARSGGKRSRDLKDLDSYAVCGRRVDEFGVVSYQVVWRDGGGCLSSDDDDEDGGGCLEFDDYSSVEYVLDGLVKDEPGEDEMVSGRVRKVVDVVDLTDSP